MRGELFASIVTTSELLDATSDERWLASMLRAEAALALAAAEFDAIPHSAADAIAVACEPGDFDLAAIGLAARDGGNPVIPLVEALRECVPAADRDWVHWGATSQDIVDTAMMLVARDVMVIVERELSAACDACAVLADRHRSTAMVGRTLLQHAPPITFGLKAALWLNGILDARRIMGRVVPASQLGGPVGTLASMGAAGPAIATRFAELLELDAPLVPWHTARQRVAELSSALAIVAGTAAKIGGDVALLMQPEVAEVAEPAAPGRGVSSSIPGKRNPILAVEIDAAARRAIALVPVVLGSLVASHERPAGAWHAEWDAITDLLALAGGAASNLRVVLEGLEVDPVAMAARAGATSENAGATSTWIDRVLARHASS